jgi:Ni/Fe-hydrogenase 1 B-type cytochrome subunit
MNFQERLFNRLFHPRLPNVPQVYVFQLPVRMWHWVTFLCMVALVPSGILIGAPLPALSGEASDHYLMGWVRFVHFASGLVFAVIFAGRIIFTFWGNRFSRELFLIPAAVITKQFWGGLIDQALYYLFIKKHGRGYNGHNPLAGFAMSFMFAFGSTFMILSGLALYGEAKGMNSWLFQWYSSWLIPLVGGSQALHTYHHLCMYYLLVFSIAHMYMVMREDIYQDTTVISTMVNGWRVSKR